MSQKWKLQDIELVSASPADGASTANTNALFVVAPTGGGGWHRNTLIHSVLDGVEQIIDPANSGNVSIPYAGLSVGSHTWRAFSDDSVGDYSPPVSVNWTVTL